MGFGVRSSSLKTHNNEITVKSNRITPADRRSREAEKQEAGKRGSRVAGKLGGLGGF